MTDEMHAMVLSAPGAPLRFEPREDPVPGPGDVRVKVGACGVCRTDLHVVDGELPDIAYPIVPGHEVVGRVDALGAAVTTLVLASGSVFPGWAIPAANVPIAGAAGKTSATARASPVTRATAALPRISLRMPVMLSARQAGDDVAIAPLLCGGLIGWRSLVMAGDGKHLGIFGFGAAGHIIAQVARWQGRSVYAFTRKGDVEAQGLAKSLGAEWAGSSEDQPPVPLDAAIIFAPVGDLVPPALRAVRKGGRVVCAGIHMSDIPSFPYRILWEERQLLSVANLTRGDGIEFFKVAAQAGIRTHTSVFPLREANEVLSKLRAGQITGAAVLQP